MKNTKLYGLVFASILAVGGLAGCGSTSGEDVYDKDGRLVLDIMNVYFEAYDGSDIYTEYLNEKFNVKIEPSQYEYDNWDEAVNIQMNGNDLPDALQYNLKAYNFGSTYEEWAEDMMIKALPDDMSRWPNLQSMLSKVSNLDALKIDGKLYGIPVLNDLANPDKDFSNFTYVYRRDWAKAIDAANEGKAGYVPVYKEGDVYTWEEFNRLLAAFKANPVDSKSSVLVDESWGFPSITNFYKDAPHCFTKDESGKAINNFTSDNYIEGLETSKSFVSNIYYSQDQFNFPLNKANQLYYSGQAAVLYDNFSLANYIKLRESFKKNQKYSDLDDGTALLKVMGPDGKFAIEGTENWFSMTMFNYDISETKLNKILDILDYLLSEEGTRLAIYGKEGYDYNIVDGEIVLSELGWEKGSDGKYGEKPNGAKFLRYMATLGNDTKPYDPYTDMDAFNVINDWMNEMKEAKANGKFRVVKEPADISWISAPYKNDKTESILADANVFAMKYCFGKYASIDAYKAEFDKDVSWGRILKEINDRLGK